MGLPSTSGEPRFSADRVLHQVVRDHFESFCLEAARLRNGDGLPGFVEREFREFLQCGALAAGFARFQCRACRHDRLVAQRVDRLLERRGLAEEDSTTQDVDPWVEESPALAGLSAAAVPGVAALGTRAGSGPRRCGDVPDRRTPAIRTRCQARECGFDLHAGLVVPAGQPDRLERLCRYVLRPPVTQDRLQLTADGEVMLQLRHRWTDGTRTWCSRHRRSWSDWPPSRRDPAST